MNATQRRKALREGRMTIAAHVDSLYAAMNAGSKALNEAADKIGAGLTTDEASEARRAARAAATELVEAQFRA